MNIDLSRKEKGGIRAFIGYVLSPVSWWNDLVVNIPLAYVFALPFAFVSRSLFLPAMIVGYWITNVVGFLLLHHGAEDIVADEDAKRQRRKQILQDFALSVLYTALVVALVHYGYIRFPTDYFR